MTKTPLLISAVLFTFTSLPQKAEAFSIQFDYSLDSSGFFNTGSDARARLLDAGAFFEGIIGDDLGAVTPSGGNNWVTEFEDPSTGLPAGAFGYPQANNPTIPADTIIVYVGARGALGDLGLASPGTVFNYSPTGGAWEDEIFVRGETGATQGGSATDFAPWGGSLAVDSGANWDFGIDDATLDPTEHHFYSLVLHEIGHLLGVGSADSWSAQVNGSNQFTGADSVAENGGNVALQTGGAHFAEGTTSDILGTSTSQESALDPTLAPGTVKLFTELDVAALSDIGWEIVSPVPEPSTALLSTAGLIVVCLRRRKRA